MSKDSADKKVNKSTSEQPTTSRKKDSFKRLIPTTTIPEDNTHARHESNGNTTTTRSKRKAEQDSIKEEQSSYIPLIQSSSPPSPPSPARRDATMRRRNRANRLRQRAAKAKSNGDPSSSTTTTTTTTTITQRKPPTLKELRPTLEPTTNIGLNNIPATETELELKAFLENEIGPVNRLELKSAGKNASLTSALVKFENDADATLALEKLNDKSYKDQKLTTKAHLKFFDQPGFHHVYVTNLPPRTSWVALKKLFTKQMERVIATAMNVTKKTPSDTGRHGWVTFAADEDATQAIALFQGYEYEGHKIQLTRNGPLPPLKTTKSDGREIYLQHELKRKLASDEAKMAEPKAKQPKTTQQPPPTTKKAKNQAKELEKKKKDADIKREENKTQEKLAKLEARIAAAAAVAATKQPSPPPSSTPTIAPPATITTIAPPATITTIAPPATITTTANPPEITGDDVAMWQQLLPPDVKAAVTTNLAIQQQDLSPTQAMSTLSVIAASGVSSFLTHLVSGPGAHLPPRGPHQIYVTNLPLATTSQDLIDLFVHVGPVLRTEILWYQGQPRGEGLVRFENSTLPIQAIERFNGYIYGGLTLSIYLDAE